MDASIMEKSCHTRFVLVIMMDVVAGILFAIGLSMTVWFILCYYKAMKSDSATAQQHLPKCIFKVMLIFLIVNLGIIGIYIPYQTRCISTRTIYTSIFYILYALQIYLLIYVWYTRLKHLFNSGSTLKLSVITVKIYKIYFIILALIEFTFIIIQFLYVVYGGIYAELSTYFIFSAYFFLFLGMISLSILFIVKLIQVYKYIDNNPSLINVITRYVILTIISLSITLLTPFAAYLRLVVFPNSMTIQFFQHYIVLFDAFTNCLCTLLSFTYYDKLYNKWCNRCDNKCNNCWTNLAKNQMIKKVGEQPELTMTSIQFSTSIQSSSEAAVDIASVV